VKDSVLAYTAGILDGEGYLGSWLEKKKYYRQRVAVHMKYEDIPKWLSKNIVGGTKVHYKSDNTFCWNIEGKAMRKLLEETLPYMVQKVRQAEIMLEIHREENDQKKRKLYLELKGLHN